jgi:bis(5'-nucleosidyl)-tetraphosphatase
MSTQFRPAAGIVVVRQKDGLYEVLCLVKPNGRHDLTKGIIDLGESALEAAKRETLEEAGISDLDFAWGSDSHSYDACTMFVAKTDSLPEIMSNPHTGISEHVGYRWMLLEDCYFKSTLPKFLKPSIAWAYEKIYNATL